MTIYKLDIPEFLLPILSDAHKELNGTEVTIFQHHSDNRCSVDGWDVENVMVFVSWLTEIKEDPWRKYFEETYKDCSQGKKTDGFYLDIKEAFQAGEQNNELRHRETKRFEDILVEFQNSHEWDDETYSVGMYFWKACKESHNIK